MIYLARRRWWLLALVLIADVVIALTVADTIIRWELDLLKEQMGR